MSLNIINCAVDSLSLSYVGAIDEEKLEELAKSKERAQVVGEKSRFQIGTQDFGLLPRGVGFFSYALIGPDCTIKLSSSQNMPTAYLEINALYLAEHGHVEAVDELTALISLLGKFDAPTVSRIDLCVDFQGWTPTNSCLEDFVSRSNKRRRYEKNNILSTVYFGSGDLLCRIYNKTLQIAEKQGKGDWVHSVWTRTPVFEEELPVWRVEFQLRRAVIKTFDCPDTVDGLFAHLHGIWQYLTTDWLSLRKQTRETRKERRPVATNWQKLQSASFPGEPCRRVKDTARLSNLERVLSRTRAGLVRIGAITNDCDLERVCDFTRYEIRGRYKKYGSSFEEDVRRLQLQDPIEPF